MLILLEEPLSADPGRLCDLVLENQIKHIDPGYFVRVRSEVAPTLNLGSEYFYTTQDPRWSPQTFSNKAHKFLVIPLAEVKSYLRSWMCSHGGDSS